MLVWRLSAPASTVREASCLNVMVFNGLSRLVAVNTRLWTR
jgi:hypothetical protein